jgi:hypothetical protein
MCNAFRSRRSVGLDFQPEAGVESWLDHRDAGRCSGEGVGAHLAYLLRLNIAHNYINGLRKFSNDPAWVAVMARRERKLAALLSGGAPGGVAAMARRARMRGADCMSNARCWTRACWA